MTNSAPATIAFRRILILTDFSDVSDRAVEYAKRVAKQQGSSLLLARVIQPVNPVAVPEPVWVDEEVEQRIEDQLEQKGAELRSEGFHAQAIFVIGEVQDEVLALASKEKADLIFVGTHSRTGIGRLLFGSDAEAVLRNANCPVVVMGPGAPAAADWTWPPKDVICATTLDPDSAWIAGYAYRLANEFQARFMVLDVENPAQMSAEAEWLRFEGAFRNSLPEGIGPNTPLRAMYSNSVPGNTIVDVAKERHSDLIVMGARNASAASTHFLRGIVPQVLMDATCPVLVLPRQLDWKR